MTVWLQNELDRRVVEAARRIDGYDLILRPTRGSGSIRVTRGKVTVN